MISKELLAARDLVKSSVYGKVAGGGKKIVATIYSSKSLGLEEREDIAPTAKNEDQSSASTRRGSARASGAGKGADDSE
jgi:hypothetical protein